MEKYRYTIKRYDFETKQHSVETKESTNSYQRTFDKFANVVKGDDNCTLELIIQPMITNEILLMVKIKLIGRKHWICSAFNPKYLITNESILVLEKED